MPIDRGDDLSRWDAELVRRAVDNPLVRLMRNEPVDVLGRVAGDLEGVLDHIGDHRHGVAKHFATFHAQMADSASRGRPAIYIEFPFLPPLRTPPHPKPPPTP